MYILDTDVSTNPLYWFMDSSALRRSTDKLDMIKTSSRIDSNLMNRIGEPVMTGNRCSASSPCRAFSNVVPSFRMADEIRKHHQRNLNLTKSDNQANEGCQPISATRLGENARCDQIQTSDAYNNGTSNLSGVINGFIVKTKQEGEILDQESFSNRNGEIQGLKKCCKDRRKEYVNKNSNNNIMSPINSLVASGKSKLNSDSESRKTRQNDCYNAENCNIQASRYLEKQKHMEKYRHSLDVHINDEKNLNGSDILKQMYESFGSNGGASNRLARASENDATTKVIHPSGHQPDYCSTGDSSCPCNTGKSTTCNSPKNHHNLVNSSTANHRSNDHTPRTIVTCNLPTSSVSSVVNTRNVAKDRSYFDRKRSVHDERETPVKYDEETEQNSFSAHEANLMKTKPSPVHSIDSLLSDRQKVLRDSYKNRQSQKDVEDKGYPYNESREEHFSRNLSSKHTDRQTVSSPHSPADHQNRTPPSNSKNETYNDKSREIFRREKEIIENSIRQNPRLEHGNPAQDIPLTFPHLLNANALAAFQANLIASIPQNAQALSAMSLAAAANPMLLGINPCLVNPYILSSLTGGDTAMAAYQQAMAQGLLQNYSAFKAAASGGQGLYPGAMHSLYGNIPFPGSSAISSALAGSMPHNSGGIYPNPQFPYIPFSAQNNENMRLDESTSRCNSNSPGTLAPSGRTTEKLISRQNESHMARKHRLSDDKAPYKSIPPPKRHFMEDAVQRATVPHTPSKHRNARESLITTKPNIKNKTPLSSKFATKLKRKSPVSERIVPTKKRQLNTVPNSNDAKTTANDFSPSALLNPSSSNKDDTGNTSQTGKSLSVASDKGTPCRNTSYKNLTRERRLVANARERTRVHTISSAFEELRQQIPSYSCSQKLSKLAILRIACSYIQSLSVLSGRSAEGTFKESVDQCTRVLQAESRARSRRKSNKAQIEWEVANYEKTPPAFEDDTQTQSLETLPPVAQRKTAAKSLSRESVAQVHDERVYRTTDDSPLHNEFSRDSYSVITARFENFSASCNQSNESVTEDKASTATDNNSLDATSGKITRSPVNDMDGDTWTSNTRTPAGDNVSIMSTWRCDDKAETESCNISQGRRETCSSPAEGAEENIAINEIRNNAEDQHIDIINVED